IYGHHYSHLSVNQITLSLLIEDKAMSSDVTIADIVDFVRV
ncbi:20885_t:CDS:1, partial [Cetraspora pellucida]